MENKKMSCWDFVFSSVKTHIDDLVRQADKYTKDMNEDFEHFFCWYAEDMYKTQRELSCYRALKVVLSAGSHDDVKLYMESKINSLTDSLLTGSISLYFLGLLKKVKRLRDNSKPSVTTRKALRDG